MFNDEGTMFFVNSKDLKLEGLNSNMAFETGDNMYDFEYNILRRYSYEFLILFEETDFNEYTDTFTQTKYYVDGDAMQTKDSLAHFSLYNMIPIDLKSQNEFKKQFENNSIFKISRKMKKVYRKNEKAHKKNTQKNKTKVLR